MLKDVELFLKKYSRVLLTTAGETHLPQEELVEYQLLSNEDIPTKVWDKAEIQLTSKTKKRNHHPFLGFPPK